MHTQLLEGMEAPFLGVFGVAKSASFSAPWSALRSHGLGWPQPCCVDKDELEFLIPLPPLPSAGMVQLVLLCGSWAFTGCCLHTDFAVAHKLTHPQMLQYSCCLSKPLLRLMQYCARWSKGLLGLGGNRRDAQDALF